MKYLKMFEEWIPKPPVRRGGSEKSTEEDITKANCRNCGAAYQEDKTTCPWCKSAYVEEQPEEKYSEVRARKSGSEVRNMKSGRGTTDGGPM